MKRAKAAIEPGDQNLLFEKTHDLTLLHAAAKYGLLGSVQQLIKARGKKLLFAADKFGRTALHCASHYLEPVRQLIKREEWS